VGEDRSKHVIDVEQLVDELKGRVEKQRAAGAYADDLSGTELQVPPPAEPPIPDTDAQAPRVQLRPELGFSSKPVIGPVITLVKRFILRLIHFVLDDLARQADAAARHADAAIAHMEWDLALEAATRERQESEFRSQSAAQKATITAEIAARERVAVDVKSLAERIAAIDTRLDHLQLEARLARLERGRRPVSVPAEISSEPGATAAPAPAPFDYEAFEGRFRPERSVRERLDDYVDLLRDRKRVVDLGCGRGELVELLRSKGVSAYGVEIDPDFVSLLEEKGIEVVAVDAVSHLAELDSGAVDGITAIHVVEHLPAAAVSSLVALASDKLTEDGVLVLETPNPESLVAGSINFHRDLKHVRPIHPDTLAFLCESAGFSGVDIRRASPVPENELLPTTGDEKIDDIVAQLNELLYGYQDYAVVARK
jgi:O-antigen chain-terminating methyltransferase